MFCAALMMVAVSGCSPQQPDYWQGYLEGDYLLIAPLQSGRIEQVMVKDGQHVAAGEALFQLDAAHADLMVVQAAAAVEQARAMFNDLGKGARQPELSVLQASLREAGVNLAQAKRELKRLEMLVAKHFVSDQQLEQGRSNVQRIAAGMERLHAQLAVAGERGRSDQVAAAQAEIEARVALLDDARRIQAEMTVLAPASGRVDRLILNAGELASPQASVLRFLPDQAVKLIFFVPETVVASLHAGDPVRMQCDGCGGSRSAKVTRIATDAEYTPPVLFNRDNRVKLVFRIEAAIQNANELWPGLPVEVRRAR